MQRISRKFLWFLNKIDKWWLIKWENEKTEIFEINKKVFNKTESNILKISYNLSIFIKNNQKYQKNEYLLLKKYIYLNFGFNLKLFWKF